LLYGAILKTKDFGFGVILAFSISNTLFFKSSPQPACLPETKTQNFLSPFRFLFEILFVIINYERVKNLKV